MYCDNAKIMAQRLALLAPSVSGLVRLRINEICSIIGLTALPIYPAPRDAIKRFIGRVQRVVIINAQPPSRYEWF